MLTQNRDYWTGALEGTTELRLMMNQLMQSSTQLMEVSTRLVQVSDSTRTDTSQTQADIADIKNDIAELRQSVRDLVVASQAQLYAREAFTDLHAARRFEPDVAVITLRVGHL